MSRFDRTFAVSCGEKPQEPMRLSRWDKQATSATVLVELADPISYGQTPPEKIEHFLLVVSGNATQWPTIWFNVSPSALTRSYGGRSILLGDYEDDFWEVRNRRRWKLIDKSVLETLTLAESEELKELQMEMDRFLQKECPLPFEELEVLRQQLGSASND